MFKGLCLDFDGVIVDSTRECIYVAVESFKELNKDKSIEFNEIEYEQLVQLRPMVRGAAEYLKAIHIVLNKEDIKTHNSFLSYSIENLYKKNSVDIFRDIFYKKRRNLMASNIKNWIDLHDYYYIILNLIKKILTQNKKVNIYIVSLKDKNSISTLLKYKGFNNIPFILDCEAIKSKPQGLDLICKKYDLTKDQILFVDDNPLHLNECIFKGYKNCYMPEWNSNCRKSINNPESPKLIDIDFIKNNFDI